jgi:Dyp-type peroxidase family
VTGAGLDLADIQGDILRAYGNRYGRTSYVLIGVGDAAAGRRWLQDRIDRVTTAVPWHDGRPESTFNVALTRAGLTALGVSDAKIQSFSDEFLQGMAARAQDIGDLDASAPDSWESGLGTGEAHVLVTINAQSSSILEGALSELRGGLEAAAGLSIVAEVHAELLKGTREHFGFADGFSQPAIEGVSDDKAPGEGVPLANGWRALAAGEFILGYEDEESRVDPKRRLPSAPDDPLGRNGTYMVWRKLYQDVALFRRTVREASHLYPHGDEHKLLAKLVGRWPNGAPLVTEAGAQPKGFDPKAPGANDFRYGDDADGLRCPLGAHVRRSNPRDALGFEGKLTFRHRLIRRGMPYGPPLDHRTLEDDGQDRGLVFVCFNASISRQFESVQTQWLNTGNSFHLGEDSDFIIGGAHSKMTIQGDPPFFLSAQESFITTRGGEYLFVPGITALAAIADDVAG